MEEGVGLGDRWSMVRVFKLPGIFPDQRRRKYSQLSGQSETYPNERSLNSSYLSEEPCGSDRDGEGEIQIEIETENKNCSL